LVCFVTWLAILTKEVVGVFVRFRATASIADDFEYQHWLLVKYCIGENNKGCFSW
jgi:hypothetical protein